MTQEFKPFQTVINIVNGKGGEGREIPRVPVPPGYVTIGEIPLELRELSSQNATNTSDMNKIFQSLRSGFSAFDPETNTKIRAFNSKFGAGRVLDNLFTEAVFSVLPDGNRWLGDFYIHRNWILASPANSTVLLPDIKSPGGNLADGFYSTFVRICKGARPYDDTMTFGFFHPELPTIGKIDSSLGKQFHMMCTKYRNALLAHNPYETEAGCAFAFKDAPFLAFQKWHHDYNRLERISEILEKLVGLCIVETLGWEKINEPSDFPVQKDGGLAVAQFNIRGDWEIVRVG